MKQSIDPITPVWSNTNTSVGIDTIHICILIKQFNKLELGLLLRTFPSESTLFLLCHFGPLCVDQETYIFVISEMNLKGC